jgi:ketosteroid isomerase-like protein
VSKSAYKFFTYFNLTEMAVAKGCGNGPVVFETKHQTPFLKEKLMRRLFIAMLALVASAVMLTSCAPMDSNAAANGGAKPANAANSASTGAANTAAKTAPVDRAAVEGEIKKMLDEFAATLSKNDAAGLDKFYTDDYTLVDQSGVINTKAARIDAIKSGAVKMEAMKFDDLKFKVNPEGNAATVVGHVAGKNVINGKSEERNSMATWVVVKDPAKGWQFLNAQVTDIKPGTAAPGKTEDKKPAANASK